MTRSRATRFKLRVAPEIDLSRLTVAQKDALILSLLPLVGQLEAALVRIPTKAATYSNRIAATVPI